MDAGCILRKIMEGAGELCEVGTVLILQER